MTLEELVKFCEEVAAGKFDGDDRNPVLVLSATWKGMPLAEELVRNGSAIWDEPIAAFPGVKGE